ncbi:neprilysin-1-like [Mya arenaria]|uniref:neprilysin-1-like n=1 Tax=Mya arenaria TaxID=6604 RepID=UPI0022E83E3F|nr:neprilysin-1-like [Mya arenaria]
MEKKNMEQGTVRKGNPTGLYRLFLAGLGVTVVGLVAGIVVLSLKLKDERDNPKIPEVCATEGCTRAAARVLDSLDSAVDPCENFYQYSCGGFLRSHVIPEDRANIDNWGILRDNVEYISKYLLEQPVTRPNATAIQKAKDLYQSCVDTDLIEQKGVGPAIPLLEELGGWPILGSKPGGNWEESKFDLARLITTLRKYNNKVIIDMGVGIDNKNSTNHIVSFDQQDFGLPSRTYYLDESYRPMVEAYIRLATNVAIEFGANITTAEAEIREAVAFETAIANISMTNAELRDSSATYNKMTLADMKVRFPEPKPTDPVQFSWLNFTRQVFGLVDSDLNITIEVDEPVLVSALKYYEKVLVVVQTFPKRTIANYMVWRIMQNRARNLQQRFQDYIEEYNQVVYGVSTQRARWRGCVSYSILQLGAAVGSLYVREAFDEQAKGTAIDMINGLRDAFAEILMEQSWMDESTRTAAKEKADAMQQWIGYSDDILDDQSMNQLYDDVEVNSTEYFQNVLGNLQRWGMGDISVLRMEFNKNGWSDPPTTVNAQYSFLLNNIQFPAGIFQPPFYQKDQPRSMNYGGIGVVIGHEITHGFDDQGSQYDKVGNLRNWWDTTILENFQKRAQCIVDQYGGFVVPDIGIHVDGENTLGENIADNGGLKQSFRAYRKWVDSVGKEELPLPGMNLSHNQLFFINFAQIWCDKEKPEELKNSINTDPHSPAQFRVIGTLQNSQEFSETFQCKPGSFMNPKKKCSVWKRR